MRDWPLAGSLGAGRNVAIFPEGTTTDGSHVLHFHAALLQPAIEGGHAIQPLALSYHPPDGDVSLGQCLAAIVAEPRLVARRLAMKLLSTKENTTRRELAQTAPGGIVGEIGRECTRAANATAAKSRNHEAAAPESPLQS